MNVMNASFSLNRLGASLAILSLSFVCLVRSAPAQVVAVPNQDGMAAPTWIDIKGDTYAQRAHFASGVERLSSFFDKQIALLKAKRAKMTTDLKDWDFAMKEVDESRSFLTSRMTELAHAASPEAWASAKEKIAEAWERSQAAVDKMNTTVTS